MTALQKGAAAARSLKAQRQLLATARIALKHHKAALARQLIALWRTERAQWSTLIAA